LNTKENLREQEENHLNTFAKADAEFFEYLDSDFRKWD
jgi:hypothetical protein